MVVSRWSLVICVWACGLALLSAEQRAPGPPAPRPVVAGDHTSLFVTSENCLACHNGLTTTKGEDISIANAWRSSMMANSSRDPYWQASVRRETIDHPAVGEEIQDECSTCHMPMSHTSERAAGRRGRVFEHLPLDQRRDDLDLVAADGVSCAMCHQIQPDRLGTAESFTGGFAVDTRTPFFMMRMLNRYRVDLDVAALPEELERDAAATVELLQQETARVAIETAKMEGGRLTVDVSVQNLTGHKLPTAYPSRRGWLHVVVRDAGGMAIFESGRVTAEGLIEGNDNDTDPARFEPHYTEITNADQVQIYESILGDSSGGVTTGLLRAVEYLKDNRLLPRGFDKATAEPDIAVRGAAAADADFVGGSDRTRYSIDSGGAAGPFAIEAELLYEPISYRWAHNLGGYPQDEPARFTKYYRETSGGAFTLLAHARTTLR